MYFYFTLHQRTNRVRKPFDVYADWRNASRCWCCIVNNAVWVIASSAGDKKRMPKKNGLFASIVFSGANVKIHCPAAVFWEFQNWLLLMLLLGQIIWFVFIVELKIAAKQTHSLDPNHSLCKMCSSSPFSTLSLTLLLGPSSGMLPLHSLTTHALPWQECKTEARWNFTPPVLWVFCGHDWKASLSLSISSFLIFLCVHFFPLF